MTTGLRQGVILSPILSNISLEDVVKKIGIDHGGVRIGEANSGWYNPAWIKQRTTLKTINKTDRDGKTYRIGDKHRQNGMVQRKLLLNYQNGWLVVEDHMFRRVQQFKMC